MESEMMRLQEQSLRFKDKRLQTLMHYINYQSLYEAHQNQVASKAAGVDEMTKEEYGEDLYNNITNLLTRMKTFGYHPKPTKRKYIPKLNGKMRPLGIVSYEDKLVQTVMADVLSHIYDCRFYDFSYGFRKGKSCHDAIWFINNTVMYKPINWVVEADIKGFFDNMSHEFIMEFLEEDLQDKNFLRYIKRFLIAGVIEDCNFSETKKGAIQGGNISPVLANVYLHKVLDSWFEKVVKPRMRGQAYIVRFADDFLCLFEFEDDAKRFYSVLPKRLGKYGLEVAEDKTRILPFGRSSQSKESFNFLGFTFLNGKTRNGNYRVQLITDRKKLRAKKQELKKWLRSNMHAKVDETIKTLNLKLQGHYQYYGVNGNLKSLQIYYFYCVRKLFWTLRRRGQRHPLTWEKFKRKLEFYPLRKPKICNNIWNSVGCLKV